MPKLPRISGENTIRALQKLGFIKIRQKGSHVILKRQTPQGEIGCVVPAHKGGTLKGILKQAKISEEDFLKML
jgi:predicted RNA binding protein YcfA (HicA-like mRNA interferase family)